jgi:hypothetical protein
MMADSDIATAFDLASKDMTNEVVLQRWDEGKNVWSIEMGGIGPGYEQAIQNMGFAMLRVMVETPPDWQKAVDDKKYWWEYMDQVDANPRVSAIVKRIGPSGAQHGAAMNMASVFARHGYAKGMSMVKDSRHIQVNKTDQP